ncbi:thioredoxin domain-containing protein [Microvirga terrae]|uniref:Thioredoxin domain-containing protein n=1 Tax=Microvirga terrae TaxID=2740529 RepID=A0ABY5RVA2_9HYPH|nr:MULTISPECIES: thioredoxin domain-containing protein [Microvirga]MBQ0823654.1 thioredoxin domain-containing protein [Microvirga sp. HBU67558]UVF19732.1 thioredoxin domain-containing protein [Microvirga terrae]
MILSRRVVLAGLALSGTKAPALAQAAPEPQLIPVELIENALSLPSAVRLGHPHGDVIMVEYFDYNCPWCKRSAQALPDLLKAEPELSYVLVNFAVLSPQSVAATRAALAYLRLYGPERYLPLHLALFSLRGTVDGPRALAAAERLGGDTKRMTELADSETTTGWMKDAFATGNDLGLVATPSFLIGTEAYIGGMSLEQKRDAIARARG